MVVDKYATRIINRVQSHYLSGAALKVKSNRLRSSITRKPGSGVRKSGRSLVVSIGTNVKYGKAWEEGFIMPKIFPKKKKALKFTIKGETIFAASTRANIENARPFLQPAFDDFEIPLKRELENLWENLAK
jgi:hypothetical protein